MYHGHAGDFWCIVEDIRVPDMEKRRGPKENWGTTSGRERRIHNLTDDSEKPLGEWNQMLIECLGNEIKVWVNGDLVNHGTHCTASSGQIALQAEGSEVAFRKLELVPITQLTLNLCFIRVQSVALQNCREWLQKNSPAAPLRPVRWCSFWLRTVSMQKRRFRN